MMKFSLSFFLIIHLSTLFGKEVRVNTPVSFPCPCSKNATVLWSKHYYSNKHEIAKRTNEMYQILNSQFQNRSEIIQNTTGGYFDFHIPQAAFNDAGYYWCSCDGKDTYVYLQVIYYVDVTVTEGSNVTLPCHRDTWNDFNDITWKKNNKTVLSYTAENKREKAQDGRFMLKKAGVKVGDFSLHIKSVNVLDAGPYRCLFNNELRKGEPHAVLLTVKGAETLPPATVCSTILGLLLGLVVLLLGLVVIGFICYVIKSRRSPQPMSSQPDRAPVQEKFQLVPKNSSTRPIIE